MVCPNCRSEYELTSKKQIMRDSDSIDCQVCGEELHSWSGAITYFAKLLKRGTPPKVKD